jgi:RNA polymerase sigma-70 factor (ECF subfamily)
VSGQGSPYPAAPVRRPTFDEGDRDGEIVADLSSLADVVQAARRGEAQAWDALFERFHPSVHAYALARLGDWAGAEDVTQEVFVAAVTSVHRLRDHREPAVQAWFLHICRHKVVDHVRHRSRQRREPAAEAPFSLDPQHIVETRQRAGELREAMESLTEDQRDILIRRFVLDQSLDDVAAGTGRSVGAVKALQHRALASLGRRLAPRSAA